MLEERFIGDNECVAITGLSRSTLYRQTKAGRFPAKYGISWGRSAYRYSDVMAWIDGRPIAVSFQANKLNCHNDNK